MKKFTFILAFLLGFKAFANPVDEGMWLPLLIKDLNYEKMKAMGLKLTPEQIYDANNASMKDAIVWFGGFCTGEVISDKGLVLTNHHCGYDAITTLSTPQDNILDNGFFAKNYAEERKVDGLWASILVRMEDVSDQVLPALAGLKEEERNAKINELAKMISDKAVNGTHYNASVKGFFNNNQFFLFIFEKYTDIRLVGAPPQNIGKFGGDTDNWIWPRHTGDFSMFRIYAGKDNKPANYSEENIPFTPRHSLPVSLKGVKEGDYSMVYGYPGRTNRYETSYGVQLSIEKTNPSVVTLRDARLKAMMAEMVKSDSVRLLLSVEYAQVANYWKYFIGQTEQLKKLKVVDQKKATEDKFQLWANDKPEYQNVLGNLRSAYNTYTPYALQGTYLNEGIFGSKTAVNALQTMNIVKLLNNKDTMAAARIASLKEATVYLFESYNLDVDRNILAATLNLYYENIPKEQHPELIAKILKKYKAATPQESFKKYAADAFAKTAFNNPEKMKQLLDKQNAKAIEKDPMYEYAMAFYNNYFSNYKKFADVFNATKNLENRLYLKGLMEMDKNQVQYPDANSTIRLTYGKVSSYNPKDGVHYNYYTTADGILEKYIPGDYEFNVPARLLELCKNKDYGQYKDENGELPVGFITDNDITGGNSGSPVINGNGELIGLAFDGNWEAMSGDIAFDIKYKRCINVDIRYVLFIIDKYHGASNIINELKLVK